MARIDRFSWPLIAAVALAASACGHAIELALEDLRLFGDARASYAHSVQLFTLEMAGALALVWVIATAGRLLGCALARDRRDDCFLPALDGIRRLGFGRCAASLLVLQFAALVSGETIEQAMSGYRGGIGSIAGTGHVTAVVVHLVVGLLFALGLRRFAAFICAQTRALTDAIALFVRRVRSRLSSPSGRYRHINLWSSVRKASLLALGLANRPPPFSFATA